MMDRIIAKGKLQLAYGKFLWFWNKCFKFQISNNYVHKLRKEIFENFYLAFFQKQMFSKNVY